MGNYALRVQEKKMSDKGLEILAKKLYIAYLECELNWKYQNEELKKGEEE